MTIEEAKRSILDYIDRNGDASFAGLMQLGDWTRGDMSWELDTSNCILWSGMSELFCDAMAELRKDKAIEPVPCHPLVYLADGMALQLPRVTRFRKQGWKKPHWLPVVFVRCR